VDAVAAVAGAITEGNDIARIWLVVVLVGLVLVVAAWVLMPRIPALQGRFIAVRNFLVRRRPRK
jgi:hypothetical protein